MKTKEDVQCGILARDHRFDSWQATWVGIIRETNGERQMEKMFIVEIGKRPQVQLMVSHIG